MAFNFSVSGAQVGASSVIDNSGGARGLQVLCVMDSLGDDDNRAALAIVAISADDDASAEYTRVSGIPPNDTALVMLYPGIAELTEALSLAVAGVLPAKFQVQASNAMGLEMQGSFFCELLP